MFSIQGWSSCLKEVSPQDNFAPHPLVCLTSYGGSPYQFEVLSKEKYQNFYKDNTLGFNTCLLLSFNEIVSISTSFLKNEESFKLGKRDFRIRRERDHPATEIANLFNDNSPLLENLTAKVKSIIQSDKVVDRIETKKSIASSLQAMALRTFYKHSWGFSRGIWWDIKSLIWIRFFNKSKEIIELKKHTCDQEVKGAIYGGCEKIRVEWVLRNMEFFHRENGSAFDYEVVSKRFDTPKKIEELWIAVYAEAPVSEVAAAYRKTVVEMNRKWQELLELRDSYDKNA